MEKIATLMTLVLLGLSVGCSSTEFRDGNDDTAVSIRSRTRSLQAWTETRELYEGIPNPEDFGKGFRDGHYDVAMGGSGRRPVLPPREYRGLGGRNDGEQSRLTAYMDGHEHGVLASIEQSRLLAERSWEESGGMFDGIPHLSDFRRGYMDGVFRTSMGRSDAPPAAMPGEYSGRPFESGPGKARAKTYRDGYQHGALTAKAEMSDEEMVAPAFADGIQ